MFVHGKDTDFRVDNAAGALTDISAFLTNVDFPDAVESAETTTFGTQRKTRIAGHADGSFSVSGNWDAAVDAVLAGIKGLIGSFQYGPAGSTAANAKYTGEALCTNYQVQSPVGGVVTFSASFEINSLVRGVYP